MDGCTCKKNIIEAFQQVIQQQLPPHLQHDEKGMVVE